MGSIVKVMLAVVLSASFVTSQGSFADYSLGIGNISVTGGGMQLVGTVSTATLSNQHKAFTYVGWTLILVGTLVSNKDLIVTNSISQEFQASQVWDGMVRQARVLAVNPALAQDDVEIVNAAQSLQLNTSDLAKMVVDIDSGLSTQTVETKYFARGFDTPIQRQAFNNIVALASMN